MLVRLYLAAVVVLVLLVVLLYGCRRWLAWVRPSGGGQLSVLGAVRIGSRVRVFLVQAPGQRLLAGVDSTGMKMLVAVPSARQTIPSA
jgi:flagellar biogenesis protein FliO